MIDIQDRCLRGLFNLLDTKLRERCWDAANRSVSDGAASEGETFATGRASATGWIRVCLRRRPGLCWRADGGISVGGGISSPSALERDHAAFNGRKVKRPVRTTFEVSVFDTRFVENLRPS